MLKVAYTRSGKTLHLMDVDAGRRTLCGRPGFVHPTFDGENTAHVLAVKINAGCQHCIREADKGGEG